MSRERTTSRAGRAIAKGLKAFPVGSASSLHKRVHAGLSELQANHGHVVAAFDRRRDQRVNADQATASETLANAEASLVAAKAHLADVENAAMGRTGSDWGDLTAGARRLVDLAEARVNAARPSQPDRTTLGANGFDQQLRDWYDSLVSSSVEALWDEEMANVAIGLFGAATIVGGVVGSPIVVAAATAASAAQYTAEMLGRLDRGKSTRAQDEATARVERGLVLIETANQLSKDWLAAIG